MGYSIFIHSHLHLVCETNGQRRMVLGNLQKAFDIINHTILLQKMYSVGVSKINYPMLPVPTKE